MVLTKRLFKFPRYWYHLSTTLKDTEVFLTPRDDSTSRSFEEPDGARICVAPTIEQCITAIAYCISSTYSIYRTKKKTLVTKPPTGSIFDFNITHEGWIEVPTTFVKIGSIDIEEITNSFENTNNDIIEEAASGGNLTYSKEVLNWWKKLKVKRFIRVDNSK